MLDWGMKMRFLTPRLIVLTLVITCLGFNQQVSRAEDSTEELRSKLTASYEAWRNSVTNKNAQAWERNTTRHRRMITRNLIVSQKQPYPEAIFRVSLQPPPLTGLRLLEVQANGPTAHLAYFGKLDLGDGTEGATDDVMILKFFLEDGAWRFDSSRYMSLDSTPDLREALQTGIPPGFLERPELSPPGILPPTPPPCREPEYVGGYDIQCFGYEAGVKVNGTDYGKVANHDGKQIIIGGLSRGKNELELSIKPLDIPKDGERYLQINVVVLTGNPQRPSIKVFTWETRADDPGAKLTFPVLVTNSTLQVR